MIANWCIICQSWQLDEKCKRCDEALDENPTLEKLPDGTYSYMEYTPFGVHITYDTNGKLDWSNKPQTWIRQPFLSQDEMDLFDEVENDK